MTEDQRLQLSKTARARTVSQLEDQDMTGIDLDEAAQHVEVLLLANAEEMCRATYLALFSVDPSPAKGKPWSSQHISETAQAIANKTTDDMKTWIRDRRPV